MGMMPQSYTAGTATFDASGNPPTTAIFTSALNSPPESVELPLDVAANLMLWALPRVMALGVFTESHDHNGASISWYNDSNPRVTISDGTVSVDFDPSDMASVVTLVGGALCSEAAFRTMFPEPSPTPVPDEDLAILRWLEPDGTLVAETERPLVPVMAALSFPVANGAPIVVYGPSDNPAGDPLRYHVESVEDTVIFGEQGQGPIRRLFILRQAPLLLV